MSDPEFSGPVHLGGAAQAWYDKAHRAWQAAARRDPERYLYVPELEPSAAGKLQQRWVEALGGRTDYATWRLANVTGHVADRAEVAEKWLEKGKRKPLVLDGQTGTGKSCLAAATAHSWWQAGARPVVWAPVPELLTRDNPHRQALSRAGELALVVLDDLTTAAAAWPSFTALVEQLYGRGVRLVVTTNMVPSDWHDPDRVDPRVRRRLYDNAERVPMPDQPINDQPPEGADTRPCPYDCARGYLVAEDHPDGYAAAEAFAAAAGYARMPDAAAWAEQPEQLADLRAEAERQFDNLMRSLALPCPHCSGGR